MTLFIVVRYIFIVVIGAVAIADYFFEVHWLWYVLPVMLFLDFLTVGAAAMQFNVFLKAWTSPPPTSDEIAITFDDGPSPYTATILDLLKKYDSKASFFCIGKNIELMPEVTKRVHEEGHFIANHSWAHSCMFPFYGKNKMAAEIRKTNALIKTVTGRENHFFRPPFGVTNPAVAKAVKITGMQVIGWNLRSFDTTTANPEKVTHRVLRSLRPGSVILLHDHLENTPEVLEAILQYAKKKQYKCVRVDRIFKFENYEENVQ